METWKPIKGYEGLYEVSDLGRVKGLRRNKVLTPFKRHNGYLGVRLYKSETDQKIFTVHRLVASAFCENAQGKLCVNHINENILDNRAENLEWVTNQENITYKDTQKRKGSSLSKRLELTNQTIRVAQYSGDGTLINTYPSINKCSAETRVPYTAIYKAVRDGNGAAHGYIWKRI